MTADEKLYAHLNDLRQHMDTQNAQTRAAMAADLLVVKQDLTKQNRDTEERLTKRLDAVDSQLAALNAWKIGALFTTLLASVGALFSIFEKRIHP